MSGFRSSPGKGARANAKGRSVILSRNLVYHEINIPSHTGHTAMMRAEDGHQATIPEIYARNAAKHSHDISLTLLKEIERKVDSLTSIEHALEGLVQVTHAAERMWDDVESLAVRQSEVDESVEMLDDTAKALRQLYSLYCDKQQAERDDHRLRGENEELVLSSYDRVLDRIPKALEAIESLKWTLMDLQSLNSPRSKRYSDVPQLLADLKS